MTKGTDNRGRGAISAFADHEAFDAVVVRTRTLGRSVFGDRTGLVLFLGAIAFFWLTWRVGFFINDNFTLANTLVGLSKGHLHVSDIAYGPARATPGLHVVGEHLYGRNYGQLFYALPFVWVLSIATAIADLQIVLVATWSLVVLAFFVQLGAVTRRPTTFSLVGVVVSLAAFGGNVAFARPIDESWMVFLALQLSTVVAAGLIGVFVYRLVCEMHDRRLGVAAGVAVVLATPVGFWATIPKRHTLTSLFAVLTLYCFYRSRLASGRSESTLFRALAYVWVAQAAWTHAPEGLVLLVSLVVVDVLTARSNGSRDLLIVGAVFVVALLPMFLTNWLIAGNPAQVPRTLQQYEGSVTYLQEPSESLPSSGSTGGDPDSGQGPFGMDSIVGTVLGLGSIFASYSGQFASRLEQGVSRILQWRSLYHIFVRSGYISGVTTREAAGAINLSVLESMPLVGLIVTAPLAWYHRVRARDRFSIESPTPERATEVLAVVYLLLLFLIYVPSLPLHAMITVRYLHPVYPIAVFFLAQLHVVRRTVREAGETLAFSYAGFVLLGGQLFVLVLYASATTIGEAVQLHALLALVAAVLLVCWGVTATAVDGYYRAGAVTVGFAGAVTTAFLLLTIYLYFDYGSVWVLPLSRVVADALPPVGELTSSMI